MRFPTYSILLISLAPTMACRMVYITGEQAESSTTSTSIDPPVLTSTTSSSATVHASASDATSSASGTETTAAFTATEIDTSTSFQGTTSETSESSSSSDIFASTGLPDPGTSGSTTDGSLCGNKEIDPGETCEGGSGCDKVTCTYCGDGIVNGSPGLEECDDAHVGDDDACDDTCKKRGLLVFISSTMHKGDFESQPIAFPDGVPDSGTSGIDDANIICLDLASKAHSAGLPWAIRETTANNHSFRAWLSDDTTSPSKEFGDCGKPYFIPVKDGNNVKFIKASEPYKKGSEVHILSPINKDEHGVEVISKDTWTNTNTLGEPFLNLANCENWKSKSDKKIAFFGSAKVNPDPPSEWTIYSKNIAYTCDSNLRIYCFEQCPPPPKP